MSLEVHWKALIIRAFRPIQVLPCAPSGPGIFRGLFVAEPEGRVSRVPILFPLPPDWLSPDRPWPNGGVLKGEILASLAALETEIVYGMRELETMLENPSRRSSFKP